jgi:hypothetical protein
MRWLELMKETVPRLARIGVLWDPATGFTQLRAIETVAAIMNIELEIVDWPWISMESPSMTEATPMMRSCAIALNTMRGASNRPRDLSCVGRARLAEM